MSGELIRLERHPDFKRGNLFRQQPVPRGPAPDARTPSFVELQVARIARLLSELEEITRASEGVPAETLAQASRASIEKARRIIGPWAGSGPRLEEEVDGDPQPELDDERLERMYRELNCDA